MSSLVHRMTPHDLENLGKQACDTMSDTFPMLDFDLCLVPSHLILLADTDFTRR